MGRITVDITSVKKLYAHWPDAVCLDVYVDGIYDSSVISKRSKKYLGLEKILTTKEVIDLKLYTSYNSTWVGLNADEDLEWELVGWEVEYKNKSQNDKIKTMETNTNNKLKTKTMNKTNKSRKSESKAVGNKEFHKVFAEFEPLFKRADRLEDFRFKIDEAAVMTFGNLLIGVGLLVLGYYLVLSSFFVGALGSIVVPVLDILLGISFIPLCISWFYWLRAYTTFLFKYPDYKILTSYENVREYYTKMKKGELKPNEQCDEERYKEVLTDRLIDLIDRNENVNNIKTRNLGRARKWYGIFSAIIVVCLSLAIVSCLVMMW